MKLFKQPLGPVIRTGILLFFIMSFSFGNAQVLDSDASDLNKPETEMTPEIYWHVKAFRPEAKFLDVKAIDEFGRRHDVKAIQDSENTSILNVKAIMDGKRIPIKVIAQTGERFYPVKAIDAQGKLINIKAITEKGELLDVKGYSRSGNIIHLRAITKDFKYYNIISISPESRVNGVKGVKMLDEPIEATIQGVPIYAHVKAISQD